MLAYKIQALIPMFGDYLFFGLLLYIRRVLSSAHHSLTQVHFWHMICHSRLCEASENMTRAENVSYLQ